ncbi:hypothetical protein ES705_41999 [subsurface metagenome]
MLAFKLCQENPQITIKELDQALKENGFEVSDTTSATWLLRCRKKHEKDANFNVGESTAKRTTKRLGPSRRFAFNLWQDNPRITGRAVHRALTEKGFKLNMSTGYYWLKAFRAGKGVSPAEGEPPAAQPVTQFKEFEKSGLNLEQIIKAAGSVETLSVLFYQGVMRELGRKDAAHHLLQQECISKDNKISSLKHMLDEITRDRNQIMRDYNEKLAKVKVGTLTLDETTHRLVPKL